jgi:tetratricopeptide (TPR) repeat protein
MAKNGKLSCLEKRDLLNQAAVSIETLVRWGEQYEAMGLVHDAVDFFEKAHAREALERLLPIAREEGDLFLFKRLCRFLSREITRDEWLQLAAKAEEQGKIRFAAEAYRSAGDEDMAGALLNRASARAPEAAGSRAEEVELA